MKQTIWKDVPDYEGKMKASNKGEILVFKGDKWIRPAISKHPKGGYLMFGRFGQNFRGSRVICAAFHGKPPGPNYDADHINDDSEDNRPENLQWLTRKENLKKRGILKHFGPRRPVIQKTKEGNIVAIHPSMLAGARSMGRDYAGGVQNVCNGHLKTYLGFVWEYYYEEEVK